MRCLFKVHSRRGFVWSCLPCTLHYLVQSFTAHHRVTSRRFAIKQSTVVTNDWVWCCTRLVVTAVLANIPKTLLHLSGACSGTNPNPEPR
jgi:hypothetical protein